MRIIELNEIALKNMLNRLDPYTNYFDEQGIEDVRIQRSGEYGGIGSGTRFKDKRLYITEVYKDAPAAKAGLLAGDVVVKLGEVEVKDMMTYMRALSKCDKGQTVVVEFMRDGKRKKKKLTF